MDLTLKVRNLGSAIWKETIEEGKAPFLVGQFSFQLLGQKLLWLDLFILYPKFQADP